MAIRNFIQQGQAYGSTPCTVVVTLDGVEIYSGPVPTIAGPVPPQPGSDINETAFAFTLPADFSGAKQMSIQVSGSTFVLADTTADRDNDSDTTSFLNLEYSQTIDGISVNDPLTNVSINGVPRSRSAERDGQWYWNIGNGQMFEATLNVPEGVPYPDWDPAISYAGWSLVVYNGRTYKSVVAGAPAGSVPSESPLTWFTYPIPPWNVDNSYVIYDRVSDNGNIYMALQTVPAGTVTTNTDYWEYRGQSQA